MKKLVIAHPAYYEQAMGGAELQLFYLASYAKKVGFEVYYIYENKGKEIRNESGLSMIPLKRIFHRNSFGVYFSLYEFPLMRILKQLKPDVIVTRGAYSWSGIASKYAKKNHIKHIWSLASDIDPVVHFCLRDFLKPLNLWEKHWIRFSLKNASSIICQNTLQKLRLKNFYNREGIMITQMGMKEIALVKKDFEKIKILWIANLKPCKRPEIFIHIASHFKNEAADFIMIGKPSRIYEPLIKKSTNLHFLGELSNSEVNKLLCESHVLINTSDFEGFSNTFIQAWMRKVPVISMNSNPDEIISRNNIGRICPTEELLIRTIEELISNRNLLKEMGKKAHDYATKNHSVHKVAQKYMELIEK